MTIKKKSERITLGSSVPVVDGHKVKPGARVGHFDIVRKLGNGAMASVYLGQDVDLQRYVALKFLDRNALTTGNPLAQELMEKRFIREARSAAMINHPHITKIYEADFQHECWYIVMEFIDGECLQDTIDSGRQFTAHDALDFTSQVVSGLHHAWETYRIIHRDIKPANIMLNKLKKYKLVDMGLAKPVLEEAEGSLQLTTTGIPVGTPYYMSPEQAEGRADIDHRADIFSLGATIHELVTGTKTYNERSAPMVYMAQISKKYTRLPEACKGFPDDVSNLIDRMLEPKLDERIADYAEILDEVRKCRERIDKEEADKKEKSAAKKAPTKKATSVKAASKAAKEASAKPSPSASMKVQTVELSNKEVQALRSKGLETKEKLQGSSKPAEKGKATSKANAQPKEMPKIAKSPPKRIKKEETVEASIYEVNDMDIAKTNVVRPESFDQDVANIITEIRKKKNLPALDKNVMDLTNMARGRNSRVSDLTGVIQRDSSLSSNLLSTMNSSLYSPRYPIENISSAVVLLGFDKVKNLASRLSIFSQAHKSLRDGDLYDLLSSSYFAGTFTQGLVSTAGHKNGEEAFVSGLLHQMPKLILANTFPKRFKKMQELILHGTPLNRACDDIFNVPYPEVCQAIHEAWRLPPGIACSFVEGAKNSKAYLKPYIQEACHISDMLFGQVIGGKRELEATQARVRTLLKRHDFDLQNFMFNTCVDDESIRRFFHLSPAEIETMVDDVRSGAAHKRRAKMSILVDLEQPIRIIPSENQRKIDKCAERILHAAKVDHDVNKAINLAQEGITDCLAVDCVLTILLSPSRDKMTGRFYRGKLKSFDPGQVNISCNITKSKLVQTIDQKKSLRCTASNRNLQLDSAVTAKLGIRQALLVPIIVDGRPIGLFLVGRSTVTARFEDGELAQVELLSEALASIFEKFSSKGKKK